MAPVVGIETSHGRIACACALKLSYRFLIFAFTILCSSAASQYRETDACLETWEEDATMNMVLESTESSFLQTFIELHHHTAPNVERRASKMVQNSPAKSTEQMLQRGKAGRPREVKLSALHAEHADSVRKTDQKLQHSLPRDARTDQKTENPASLSSSTLSPQQSLVEGPQMHRKQKREKENAGPVYHVESSEGILRSHPKPSLYDLAAFDNSEASTTKQQEPLSAAWASFWKTDSTEVSSFSTTHLCIAVLSVLVFVALFLNWACGSGREILSATNSGLHIRHLVDQVLEPKVFATP
eukprot:TRINITY_DN3653_c0_g2_i1.p1 TRINITY_DN3653_c0_g2~~TRINITY_DN3653_c0_g2_i1.p1  ORF type:complete len:310 (+),score=36.82 TRINITY_DN3653_c0_g2_i1:36-932(+)